MAKRILPRAGMLRRASRDAATDDDTDAMPLLQDHGIHLLNGELDYDTAHDVITWIIESGLRRRSVAHLTLVINSHGGDLNCGFAIIDVMRGSALAVHTVGLGQISSCGLMIFLAGTTGHRTLTPNTSIMSHQWTGGSYGKAHELLSAKKEFDLTTARVIEHYRRCTKLKVDTIKRLLLPPHDVFLSAEEALKLNICDHIKHLA
jgi:ATP-dependent Clp protease protease subunit